MMLEWPCEWGGAPAKPWRLDMRLIRLVILSLAIVGSTAVSPSVAQAAIAWTINDANKQDRPTTVDLLGSVWFLGSTSFFGGAGWFCYPIVPEGFLPTVNDTFNLEIGAWVFYYSANVQPASYTYVGVIPGGGVRWDFNLTKEWTVFAAAKLGARVGIGNAPKPLRLDVGFSIGAYWNFSRWMFLRLETGNQGMAQVGVSIVL
jgi:hypothetical protein